MKLADPKSEEATTTDPGDGAPTVQDSSVVHEERFTRRES